MKSVREYAQEYHDRNWKLLRAGAGEKGKDPIDAKDWSSAEHVHRPEDFRDGDSVAIKLGERSGIVDIDCDWELAREIAPIFFSDLPSFSRMSTPRAHYIARCESPEGKVHFKVAGLADGRSMIIELRGNGHYTLFPGSVHKDSGESVTWSTDDVPTLDRVPVRTWENLHQRCALIAALSVITHYYREVGEGTRHDACNALLGWLLRITEFSPENAHRIVQSIARLAGDREADKRAANPQKQADRLDNGGRVTGLPKLCKLFGISKTHQDLIREWMKPHTPERSIASGFGKGVGPEDVRAAIVKLGVTISYDEFAKRYMIEGIEGFGPDLSDEAVTRLRIMINKECGFYPTKELAFETVFDEGHKNRFHPVRDYLDGLKWDGVSRVNNWLSTYGGAQDNEYTRAVGGLVLIAAVRRIRLPGTKFDQMLILEGEQGTDKSTAFAALAGNIDWFTDNVSLAAKDQVFMELTAGKWLVEISELKGMSDQKVEHLKNLLSRQSDRHRMVWHRIAEERPRQFVIVGTTNEKACLRDQTGNRRFWPVQVKAFDVAGIKRDRDLLWAEAAEREAAGESTVLDRALWAVAAVEQEDRVAVDPWEERLGRFLEDFEGRAWPQELWEILGKSSDRCSQSDRQRLGTVMERIGFRKAKQRFKGGHPMRCYSRGHGEGWLVLDWRENQDGRKIELLGCRNSQAGASVERDYDAELARQEGQWPGTTEDLQRWRTKRAN